MIKLCQDCHYENGPHARFCASCGRALRKESPGAVAQQALDEAAQAVDEMLQSPVIRDFAVKAGEVAQQTSAQFERVAKSDGVQRTLQKLSSLPGQAAKALQEFSQTCCRERVASFGGASDAVSALRGVEPTGCALLRCLWCDGSTAGYGYSVCDRLSQRRRAGAQQQRGHRPGLEFCSHTACRPGGC
ncbi:MAG: hypothetical protein V9H69_22440 [Anaerolineae bacterium]